MYWPSSSLVSSRSLHSKQHWRLGSRRIPAFSRMVLIWFTPFLMEEPPCATYASPFSTKPAPLIFQPKFWTTISSKYGSNQGVSRDRQSTFYYSHILLFSLLLILFSTPYFWKEEKNFLNSLLFLPSSFKSQLSFWHTHNSILTLSAHQKYSHLWFKIQFFLFPIQRLFS